MDTPVVVGDILEAVGEIETVKRASRLSASSNTRDTVQQNEKEHANPHNGHVVNDQQDRRQKSKNVVTFMEDSKSIYSPEITSRYKLTSGDPDATSDFILHPRPMTTSAIADKPLVSYKYKTLSTSAGSRSSRGRNPHEKLESEYRALKTELTKPKSAPEVEKPVVQVPSQTEDSPFNKYIASLWVGGRYNRRNGKAVDVKQFTMNFSPH